MKAEQIPRSADLAKPKPISHTMPRATRLILAVFIALVALVSLCKRLSVGRCQVQASHVAMVSKPIESSAFNLCVPMQNGLERCRRPLLTVTKRIDPEDPDTGSIVTITFIITGLGPKPIDVVLVQDISGSMLNDVGDGRTRLEVAQAAAITFVNELSDTDRVAIVAYSETARSVLSLTTDTSTATYAITNDLTARNGWYTNIGTGIWKGYEELITSTQWSSKTVKAMILLSDGRANRPSNDPAGHAHDRATDAGECGILIYTIGFGNGVSETLMREIAALGGGEYYYSPNGTNLGTIYQEIALELRNLVITDVLPLGVDLDCDLVDDAWQCIRNNGVTTVTIPISNSELTDPMTRSFTATVNLDPHYIGTVNTDGSEICYDGPVVTPCQGFENPIVTVGGRKITGIVFQDLNHDGYFDEDGNVLSGIVVTTSNGLKSETNNSGIYIFRTSAEPMLTVAISIPPNYVATTSAITHIPPFSGTYRHDFGLYTGLIGEKHSLDINGPPLFEEDELAYTITIHNIGTTPRPDVLITDTIPISTSYIGASAHITPSGSGTVTVAGGTLTGVVDSLLSEGTITVTFLVTVDLGAEGQAISNCAYVTSREQCYRLSLTDKEGPHDVITLPMPFIGLATSAQVIRPGTEIVYTYTVSNTSAVITLTNVVIEDSHLGPISPTHFSLPPDKPAKVLTATATLTQNTRNTATVTSDVEGYGSQVSGDSAMVTVHVIEGISLTQVYTEPPPVYHGDVTTFHCSVANQDVDDDVVNGTTHIIDSLGRTLGEAHFDRLSSSVTVSQSSLPFTVPQDIVITVTTTATDDIEAILLCSDQVTRILCPIDIYEQEIYNDDDVPSEQCNQIGDVNVSLDKPRQCHDFSAEGDKDWVCFSTKCKSTLYTFIAHPLAPGVAISLTLYNAGSNIPIRSADNLNDPTSDVLISVRLPFNPGPQPLSILTTCDYHLLVESANGQSGCWTDYQLWVEEALWNRWLWLPMVLRKW